MNEIIDFDKPTPYESEYQMYANQTGHRNTCHFVHRYIDSKHGIVYPGLGCTCHLKDGSIDPRWDGL